MSKYIEQDYIGSAVSQLPTKILQTEHGIDLVVPVTDVIEIIKKAPSIGMVTCGECIYRNSRKKCPMRVFTGDNGFCSCGKGADDV